MTFEEEQQQARAAVREGIGKIRAKLDLIDTHMQNGMPAAECFAALNEAAVPFLQLKVELENVREFDVDQLRQQQRRLLRDQRRMEVKRIGG